MFRPLKIRTNWALMSASGASGVGVEGLSDKSWFVHNRRLLSCVPGSYLLLKLYIMWVRRRTDRAACAKEEQMGEPTCAIEVVKNPRKVILDKYCTSGARRTYLPNHSCRVCAVKSHDTHKHRFASPAR